MYVDHRAGRITLGEYARSWAKARPWAPATRLRVESFLTNHLDGQPLAAMPLAQIKASDVQAWATGRAQVLAPGTARVGLTTLRSVFTAAVEDRLIGSTPAARVAMPAVVAPPIVALTVEQVQALADGMPPWGRAMVLTQAGLGLRVGELVALDVAAVDFLRRTVRVEWQIRQHDRARVRPKTMRSRRTIPLPGVVGDVLAAHLAEHPPAGDGVIFSSSRGGPWEATHYGRVLKAAARRAGLPYSTSSHDLRHSYVSALLDAGVGLPHVAALIGDTVATTVRHYSHMVPGQDDRARAAIDSAWRGAPNVPVAPPENRQGHG